MARSTSPELPRRSSQKTMGSADYDEARKPVSQQQRRSQCKSRLKILLLVLVTNSLSIFIASGAGGLLSSSSASLFGFNLARVVPSAHLWDAARLLGELNVTQAALADSRADLASLHSRLGTANALFETLLADVASARAAKKAEVPELHPAGGGAWSREVSGELKLAVGPHKLPLGFTPNLGSDEMHPTLGAACARFQNDVEQYMKYDVGGECPSDEAFAQRLMLKGCEPLPRRRCHPKSPVGYVEPTPFPASLWTIPPDTSIIWDAYSCKNYSCLVHRGESPGSFDCKDCFNLFGRESHRWVRDDVSELDYSIDAVLAFRRPGTVRIGLDIGGGSGTFAARMRERNVTVVTTSMNFDGPFNSFISARGLVALHLSVAQRLPFFDGTLDIVHSMHVLSNWIPDAVLEFALFDIYRVLRPGGLFWLDHFFCIGTQLNATYVPMFDRIGFQRLRWNAGRKLDRGIQMNEWYLSALLEKPMT